ncbi:carbonic anhydrase 7-like [Artemia franciscana]|uniref:carbonic anhydrase 7-like n=1 Tax=Artemia franciscana TaxID=6661 RepID=UPI0032DB6289
MMLIATFLCTTLLFIDPVVSFFLPLQPSVTILTDKKQLTTTVTPVCYELADDFRICDRKAKQYGYKSFYNSRFLAYNPSTYHDFYGYSQANQIQPSMQRLTGVENLMFLPNILELLHGRKKNVPSTVIRTDGSLRTVTIHCINPEEGLPSNLCMKNPCAPNPCTKNGDTKAVCNVKGTGFYSCQCTKGFFDNGISCIGKEQSPVNIDTSEVVDENIQDLELSNYDSPLREFVVQNTGKTAQASVKTKSGEKITISGAGLSGTYEFEQLHFHWDLDTMEGSEHTIDGVGLFRYPVEVHLVHRNTKYTSVEEALAHRDGLTVIGVLFEISAEDNPDLEEFYSIFSSITKAKSKIKLTDPSTVLNDFLPGDSSRFYRYRGSLTTPPFSEVVEWIVMADRIVLSQAQVMKFGVLLNSKRMPIRFNDRDVQPLKNGTIYRRYGAIDSNRDWFTLLQNWSE